MFDYNPFREYKEILKRKKLSGKPPKETPKEETPEEEPEWGPKHPDWEKELERKIV
jgi:hypothetical protein